MIKHDRFAMVPGLVATSCFSACSGCRNPSVYRKHAITTPAAENAKHSEVHPYVLYIETIACARRVARLPDLDVTPHLDPEALDNIKAYLKSNTVVTVHTPSIQASRPSVEAAQSASWDLVDGGRIQECELWQHNDSNADVMHSASTVGMQEAWCGAVTSGSQSRSCVEFAGACGAALPGRTTPVVSTGAQLRTPARTQHRGGYEVPPVIKGFTANELLRNIRGTAGQYGGHHKEPSSGRYTDSVDLRQQPHGRQQQVATGLSTYATGSPQRSGMYKPLYPTQV